MSDTETTALEIEEDDKNIQKIHERKSLLSEGKRKVKSPGCKTLLCKGLVISVAGILFILMLVQVWSDYGEYITTSTFPPKVYSIGEYCPTNDSSTKQLSKQYNPPACIFEQTDTTKLHCDMDLPDNPMVIECSGQEHSISIQQNHFCVTYNANLTDCVRLQIWSI
jgi:hypothetical protein